MNIVIIFCAALIPLLTGFIWYNPKTFANAWMKEIDMTEEKMKSVNMAKIFGFTFLLSLMFATLMQVLVIHQVHFFSILAMSKDAADPNSEASLLLKKIMELHGNDFRTFKHGAFHGTIGALFLALPILGINALFERRSFKYIAIHTGYWMLTMGLMGGVLCQFIEL